VAAALAFQDGLARDDIAVVVVKVPSSPEPTSSGTNMLAGLPGESRR
jgi:hypothetical protein